MKASKPGLFVLLAKLGPKLYPIVVKMHDALWGFVKSLFGIKGAGLAGSVGVYTYLFTWQMAVALIVFLAIHEYGHLWAMKKCGIKTKGMFFLPGFGAVAVAEERFGSARNEAYIALLGPVFGLVFFVLPVMGVFWYTGNALYAAIASLMAFINLVNLFPIHPLDGGHVLKALAYSPRVMLSLLITVGVSTATTVFGMMAGFSLLSYMAIIGLWDIATEYGVKEHLRSFLKSLTRFAFASIFAFTVHFLTVEGAKYWNKVEGGHSIFWLGLVGSVGVAIFVTAIFDVKQTTIEKGRALLMYPLLVLKDVWEGLRQVVGLRARHVSAIENYEKMTGRAKMWYAFAFLALVLVHVSVIAKLAKVPGAEIAKELLQ